MTERPDDTASMSLATQDASAPRAAEQTEALEFWIAITAGNTVWADPDDEVTPIERWSAALGLVAIATCITLVWVERATDSSPRTDFETYAPWIATGALLCMALRPLRLGFSVRRPTRLWPSFTTRVVLIVAVIASLVPSGTLFGLANLWPLVVVLGVEAALCAWALGYPVEPMSWWGSFVWSPLHMGILGGVAASVIYLGLHDTLVEVVPIYALGHVAVLGSSLIAAWLDRVRNDMLRRHERAVEAAAAAEHRQSAHWLHDDVSSELKLMELKLRSGTFGPSEVAAALGELDHHLRLRQLDELFLSGTVRLAEILQPFVRNAQGHGITITSVPTFDDASAVVDERLGRLFGRAVSVVTNNAIAAGAHRLGFAVHADHDTIALTVHDDAGGFDLAAVPAGRALWQLEHDPGTASISVERTEFGSSVTVVLRRDLSDGDR